MKDIDFDELDRAVSSVLTSKDKNETVVDAPVDTSQTKSAPTMSPLAEVVVATAAIPSPSISPSPAIRRSGRFMDVVHPSSDMSNPSNVASPSTRRPIVPLNNDITPDAKDTPSISDENTNYPTLDTLSEESTPRTEEPVTESVPAVEQPWPDPIDITPLQDESAENVGDTDDLKSNITPEQTDQTAAEVSEDSFSDERAQTPFLSDTKVDKRPLGAFAGSSSVDDIEPLSSADTINPEDVTTSKPDVPTVLPHELDAEVIALDSNESEPEVEVEIEPGPEPVSSSTIAPVVATAVAASIPQQYTSSNETADDTQHSVFDTNTYHQPLLPQKTYRQSRVWVWVLLVIGLLIVGAGLGALWFMAGY